MQLLKISSPQYHTNRKFLEFHSLKENILHVVVQLV